MASALGTTFSRFLRERLDSARHPISNGAAIETVSRSDGVQLDGDGAATVAVSVDDGVQLVGDGAATVAVSGNYYEQLATVLSQQRRGG